MHICFLFDEWFGLICREAVDKRFNQNNHLKSKGKETDEQPEDSRLEKGNLKGQKQLPPNAAQMSKALPLKETCICKDYMGEELRCIDGTFAQFHFCAKQRERGGGREHEHERLAQV